MAGGRGGSMRGPGDVGFGGNMGPQGGPSQPYAPTEFQGRVPKIPPPEWTVHGKLRWQFSKRIANPGAGESTGYIFTDTWSSPVFDLRPDLLSKIGNTKQGFPIWSKAARLRVGLYGENGTEIPNRINMTVTAGEFVSVFNADMRAGSGGNPASTASPNLFPLASSDVTTLFYPTVNPASPGSGNVLVGFSPPGSELGGGEGYPVRYWRVTLTFQSFIPKPIEELPPEPPESDFPVNLILDAGVY